MGCYLINFVYSRWILILAIYGKDFMYLFIYLFFSNLQGGLDNII